MRELLIKCSRCILIIQEKALFENLPANVLEEGLRKGKGYLRAKQNERRHKGDYSNKANGKDDKLPFPRQ